VDFLLTNRRTPIRPPAWHDYHHLLNFVASRYDHVILDLPDVVNDATSEVLHAASSIYIMTTPELLSLSLVPQRLAELEAARVDRSKVRILVNRWESGDMSKSDVAGVLGCEVAAIFPNDYRAVNNAIQNHSFVESDTRLGKAYRSFAATLVDEPDASQASLNLGLLLKPFRFARPAMVANAHDVPSHGRYAR
jgi:Flp pilus assembly CpaE family ATPase